MVARNSPLDKLAEFLMISDPAQTINSVHAIFGNCCGKADKVRKETRICLTVRKVFKVSERITERMDKACAGNRDDLTCKH